MFKKIIKSLLNPISLPHKIFFHSKKILNKLIHESSYNIKNFENEQKKKFLNYSIIYDDALLKLSKIRNEYKELEKKNYLPHSEHSTFFAGLSLFRNDIRNILEIGTFNAQNAFLLSVLFENANVLTVDLPRDSLEYKVSYNRESDAKRESFLEFRDQLISGRNNLRIEEKNSVNLIDEISKKIKYDLIWIDGAHFDPIVTIDIVNSLNILNDNGLILCDDVAKNLNNATWRCISILKKENIIDFELIYKSLHPIYNSNPKKRTFIAILRKK